MWIATMPASVIAKNAAQRVALCMQWTVKGVCGRRVKPSASNGSKINVVAVIKVRGLAAASAISLLEVACHYRANQA